MCVCGNAGRDGRLVLRAMWTNATQVPYDVMCEMHNFQENLARCNKNA